MPIRSIKATGDITILNSNPASGTPTPFSFVQITDLEPDAQWVTVVSSGTYTGALTARGSIDASTNLLGSGNWAPLGPTPFVSMSTGQAFANIPSGVADLFSVNVAGLKGFRVNGESTMTGDATVSMWRSVAGIAPPNQNVAATPWVNSTAAPQSGSATVIKAAAGFLNKVLVTTLGSAALNIYDNASAGSGTIIGIVPANTPVGTVLTFNNRATLGITIGGAASQPALTVSWS